MKTRGFTLLELLIALSVFAVVSLLSYQGLSSVINTKVALDAQRESLRELNLALGIVARDLSSALLRPTRDSNNRAVAALSGDSLNLEFARISAGALAQGVERVRYSVSRGALLRERYVSADPGFGPPSERRELLRGVERISWRYFSPEGAWSERYPNGDIAAAQARLPRAVELNLSINGVGELRRIVLLPSGPELVAP